MENFQQKITFEQLTEFYQKKNNKCGTYGQLWIPKHTAIKYIPPRSDEVHKRQFDMHKQYTKEQLKPTAYTRQDPFFEIVTHEDDLLSIPCNNFRCAVCRPLKKIILQNKFLDAVHRCKLKYHGTRTFPGKPYRLEVEYHQSYKILNQESNKLNKRIRFDLERLQQKLPINSEYSMFSEDFKLFKEIQDPNNADNTVTVPQTFDWITMPRSQNNPFENNPKGFCHHHTIMNIPLNKKYLTDKIIKNRYKIGIQMEIGRNDYALDYLANDYQDDEEWIIPFGQRHYFTSRTASLNDITASAYTDGTRVIKSFDTNAIDMLLAETNIETYQCFGQEYKAIVPRILPFYEYVHQYQQINKNIWE